MRDPLVIQDGEQGWKDWPKVYHAGCDLPGRRCLAPPRATRRREGNVVRVTERNTDTSVVVIGAGQAGLSVGYYLRRLGLDPGNDFVLLDRGPGTGGAWQFRWEALRLGSAHRINDLPGMEELGVSFDTADRQLPRRTSSPTTTRGTRSTTGSRSCARPT